MFPDVDPNLQRSVKLDCLFFSQGPRLDRRTNLIARSQGPKLKVYSRRDLAELRIHFCCQNPGEKHTISTQKKASIKGAIWIFFMSCRPPFTADPKSSDKQTGGCFQLSTRPWANTSLNLACCRPVNTNDLLLVGIYCRKWLKKKNLEKCNEQVFSDKNPGCDVELIRLLILTSRLPLRIYLKKSGSEMPIKHP